jgi:coenzyme PQQ precursor peptide PqqA
LTASSTLAGWWQVGRHGDCKPPHNARQTNVQQNQEEPMWRKPTITEICTGAEINSYISATK